MKKTLLILAAATLAFASCKKDDDNNGSGSTSNATLTTGRWRITSSTAIMEYPAPIGTLTVDALANLPSCQADNLFIFNSDGTATTDEGATKCNAGDPQQKQGDTWALLNNDTQLTITDATNGITITADVLTLNSTTLQVKYITNYNNIRSTTTTSYTHQ